MTPAQSEKLMDEAGVPRAGFARRVFDFSTDFHNSFESHPSRKPFPSVNLNPTASNSPHPFESLTSYP
jgi:hypothetical protein